MGGRPMGITGRPFKRCEAGQRTAGEAVMESDRPGDIRLDYRAVPPERRASRRRNRWVVTAALTVALLPAIAFVALLAWVLSAL